MAVNQILVYNDAFFKTSQTFMYYQVLAFKDSYKTTLLAERFVNPHDFNTKIFKKVPLTQPDSYISKAFSKWMRRHYETSLYINISSYYRLRSELRSQSVKALHVHFGTQAVQLLPLAKAFKIPLVVTFHGYDASRDLTDDEYRSKLPELFEYASGIIVVSSHMIGSLNLDQWREKVHVIPCCVDLPEEKAKGIRNDVRTFKILHSGRVVGKKGVPDLIRVFGELTEQLPHWELHIVGDGSEFSDCKSLVERLGINELVTFYGSVPHSKVLSMMAESDLFVLNSRVADDGDMEGTPVTLLEAMSQKVPVISTIHAGIPDVITDGEDGLLVPEKDNEALKRAIIRMAGDAELRERLGEQGFNTVSRKFSFEVMKQKILKVYKSI